MRLGGAGENVDRRINGESHFAFLYIQKNPLRRVPVISYKNKVKQIALFFCSFTLKKQIGLLFCSFALKEQIALFFCSFTLRSSIM